MNPEVRAIIRWVPRSRGGRNAPPQPANGYVTIIRMESNPEEAWTLRIDEAIELHGAEVIDTSIGFVMPDAPHHLLRDGQRFELMEGSHVVAKGVVLPASLATPPQISEFELALL